MLCCNHTYCYPLFFCTCTDEKAAKEHARNYVNAFKCWSYHTILGGVRKDIREEARKAVADKFYARYIEVELFTDFDQQVKST